MAFEFEHIEPAPVSPLATEHMVRMRDGARLGYHTLDWIVGRSWSNGRVGMFGDSY
jgi:predicted acyl esterase